MAGQALQQALWQAQPVQCKVREAWCAGPQQGAQPLTHVGGPATSRGKRWAHRACPHVTCDMWSDAGEHIRQDRALDVGVVHVMFFKRWMIRDVLHVMTDDLANEGSATTHVEGTGDAASCRARLCVLDMLM